MKLQLCQDGFIEDLTHQKSSGVNAVTFSWTPRVNLRQVVVCLFPVIGSYENTYLYLKDNLKRWENPQEEVDGCYFFLTDNQRYSQKVENLLLPPYGCLVVHVDQGQALFPERVDDFIQKASFVRLPLYYFLKEQYDGSEKRVAIKVNDPINSAVKNENNHEYFQEPVLFYSVNDVFRYPFTDSMYGKTFYVRLPRSKRIKMVLNEKYQPFFRLISLNGN